MKFTGFFKQPVRGDRLTCSVNLSRKVGEQKGRRIPRSGEKRRIRSAVGLKFQITEIGGRFSLSNGHWDRDVNSPWNLILVTSYSPGSCGPIRHGQLASGKGKYPESEVAEYSVNGQEGKGRERKENSDTSTVSSSTVTWKRREFKQ